MTEDATQNRCSISVVIPVYNERKTIRTILSRVKAFPREKEIIIVDDFSTDGTRRILRELTNDPEVRVVLQSKNMGKGAALRRGFQLATKDVVIVQDADLEYDPEDYAALLRPIEAGRADVVYGSRFLHGERRVLYFWHALGNSVLTWLSNAFTDLNLTDMETGYKAFKRGIIQNLELVSDRFGIEPEVTAKVARSGCVIYEVPIHYYGRAYGEGKKVTWKDGLAALFHIVHFATSRRSFIRDEAAMRAARVAPQVEEDVGVDTLDAFEDAKRYNAWICERMLPWLKGSVLEVGSGTGNIASEVLSQQSVTRYIATDVQESSLRTLEDRLGDDSRLSCHFWDASTEPPEEIRRHGPVDTVISSNVLEHIERDVDALKNIKSLLKPGGTLFLLVPAHPSLYCQMDKNLGHFRRYSEESLDRVLKEAGFKREQLVFHNAVGAVSWWLYGTVLDRKRVTRGDTRRFEHLVPFIKPIDHLLCRIIKGVSLISVSKSA